MAYFERLKNLFGSSNINIGRTLKDTFAYVAGLVFDNDDEADQVKKIHSAINFLVRQLLCENGVAAPDKLELYRRLLEEHYDHAFAARRVAELMDGGSVSAAEAMQTLNELNSERKYRIAEFLLALAATVDNNGEHMAQAQKWCCQMDIPDEYAATLKEKLLGEVERRRRLVRSGWGVIAALVVLLLFVVTAKLLQAVIFGLIVACVLLPLEKFFERKLTSGRGFIYGLTKVFTSIGYPLNRLAEVLTRKGDNNAVKDPQRAEEQRIIRHSVALTGVTAAVMLLAVLAGISYIAGHYMYTMRASMHSIKTEQKNNVNSAYGKIEDTPEWLRHANFYLEKTRERFEKLPPVRAAVDYAGKVIREPETREQIFGMVLEKSNGLLGFTTSILANVITFLSNVLLTIFFALLFLLKLAEFCRDSGSDKRKSEYIVRMVFNGTWLPGADEAVISEARRIIEGVFFRLRVWLKGYLTLVLVDATVYSTIFFFMDLPLFLVLGVIAGCGILLPYLGPVISCAITLLVTIAAGEPTGTVLLGILISYLIYNGIIEQFILYPAVIGEAIGLSTLETIIVVLLGAIFAGIPGMILALPAASVAKYIVPQLYSSFIRRDARQDERV